MRPRDLDLESQGQGHTKVTIEKKIFREQRIQQVKPLQKCDFSDCEHAECETVCCFNVYLLPAKKQIVLISKCKN